MTQELSETQALEFRPRQSIRIAYSDLGDDRWIGVKEYEVSQRELNVDLIAVLACREVKSHVRSLHISASYDWVKNRGALTVDGKPAGTFRMLRFPEKKVLESYEQSMR